MKTYASIGDAELAIDEVMSLARRAAEERGLRLLVVVTAGVNLSTGVIHRGAFDGCSPENGLDLAAIAVGAIRHRLGQVGSVESSHHLNASVNNAIRFGFDNADRILQRRPSLRLVKGGDA